MKNIIRCIILAAGESKNKIIGNDKIPDTMIPINGKPIIGYIIDDLLKNKIDKITIVVSNNNEKLRDFIKRKYPKNTNLSIVVNNHPQRGPGYSLLCGLENTNNDESILLYLGDVFHKSKIDYSRSFLLYENKYEDPSKWCFVEEVNNDFVFINKPAEYKKSGNFLCGLYFFKKASILKNIKKDLIAFNENIEISDVLKKYNSQDKFILIKANRFYDFGNFENYYKAKIDFLKVRRFNNVKFNDLFGTITKRSINEKKIVQEILWYRNLPSKLKIFSPRLIDYTLNKKPEYTIEYYGYEPLSDLFVFNYINISHWQYIIKKLFQINSIFKSYKKTLKKECFVSMYRTKTLKCLSSLDVDPFWHSIFKTKFIYINGKKYKNISSFIPLIKKSPELLFKKDEISIIHGDYCLSNILYDKNNHMVKLVDPRGNFGVDSCYGHNLYDIAKLRHSFCGYYDYIKSDMFSIKKSGEHFELDIYIDKKIVEISNYFDKLLIKYGFDLQKVKFIEALLFLSMLIIHKDHRSHQLAFYLTGIKKINELQL